MKKLGESGFTAIRVVLMLVIIVVVTGMGYYVWHARQNANKSIQGASASERQKIAANFAVVHKSKLPAEWGQDVMDTTTVSVSHSGEGIDTQDTCSVEALLQDDAAALPNMPDYAPTQLAKYNQTIHDKKGYTTISLRQLSIDLNTPSTIKTVTAYQEKIVSPSGNEADNMYQILTFVPLKGKYVQVTVSCGKNDFLNALLALKALTFNNL